MQIAIVRSWAPRAPVIPELGSAEQGEVSSRIRTPSLLLKRRALRVARHHHVKCPGPPASEVHPRPVANLKVGVRRAPRRAATEQDRQQRNPGRRNPGRRAQRLLARLVRAVRNARVEQPEKARGSLLVPARLLHEKVPHERELEKKRQPRAEEHGAQDEARRPAAERLELLRERRMAVGLQRKVARDARPLLGPRHAPAAAHRAAVDAAKSKQQELRSLWPT